MNKERVLSKFENVTALENGEYTALCPAHDDTRNSLAIRPNSDKILLFCHAKCTYENILSKAGLTAADVSNNGSTKKSIVASYDYNDATGKLLYQSVRYEPKNFLQRHPDNSGGWIWKMNGVERVLYRLPELLASDPAQPVFIVEGEKDVDRLASLGLVATTNVAGAGKWKATYSQHLHGRDVIILPDNDDPGRAHAQDVVNSLWGIAADVKVLELPGLPVKGDVSDWLNDGHSRDELLQLINQPTQQNNLETDSEAGPPLEPDPLPDMRPLPSDIPYFDRPHLDHFCGLYVDYASKVSPMTPSDFHESAALWLASVAIARRLKVPMPFGDVYPNLFIVWLASTTLYRKTTALDVARRIARRVAPHLLMAQDSTPEAMLADLAGREPVNLDGMTEANRLIWKEGRNFAAQRGWTLDEMSGLLAGAGKDYNLGQTEALLRLYDCDERFTRSTKSAGLTIVENAYLSLLGASTPAAMATHLNNTRLWAMGFWPRFAILTPEVRPSWAEPQEAIEPAGLGDALNHLLTRLPAATWPNSPPALTVTLGKDVYAVWQRYNKAVSYDLLTDELDERLHGTYGRMPTQVIKVATILAALDWQNEPAPVIESYHLAHAIAICEKWRASAHRAIELARDDESSQLEKRVIKQLGRYGTQGASLRTLHQGMRDKPATEIESVLRELCRVGLAAEEETQPGPKGGRKTIIYKLV